MASDKYRLLRLLPANWDSIQADQTPNLLSCSCAEDTGGDLHEQTHLLSMVRAMRLLL